MNINGLARGYMAKSLSGEEFLMHVANAIEQQLKEWDKNYQVYVMKLKDYELTVNIGEDYYHVPIQEEELESLQKSEPFDLDRKIWNELENQKLPIIRGTGNYIDTVL